MKDYGNMLGCRVFKNEDGKLEVLKIISFVNKDTARVMNLNSYKTFKISFEELLEKYRLLKPDGRITFSIVSLANNVRDVIACMHIENDIRKDSDDDNSNLPYCVCRQNIVNVYNEVIKKYDTNTFIGMTMSQETVPEGIDFKMMLACNSVEHFVSIAFYIDDKLSDILQCLRKVSLYNDVLEDLYMNNYNKLLKTNKYLVETEDILHQSTYGGYCRTLETLLDIHDFMYDVRRGFGIGTMSNISIAENRITEDGTVKLTSNELEKITDAYGFEIYQYTVIKFAKDIDINNITSKYLMFADMNENIYLMIYNDEPDTPIVDGMSTSDKLNFIMKQTVN